MKQLLLLIGLWLSLMPLKNHAQILTDTLWSEPLLDGSIGYLPGSGYFNLTTSSGMMSPGDGYNYIMGEESFSRDFLSFNHTNLPVLDSSEIIYSEVGVYQFRVFGNDQDGVYPIWDVFMGDTHFCVLDHINYGSSLDLGDWTAGDPGDPQTLQTNIGIISADSILGYKKLEVTQQVINDIINSRQRSQYRMRFTIDRDYDLLADDLLMRSGNSPITRPFLIIQYDTNTVNINDNIKKIPRQKILNQNYPNPFNSTTIISFYLPVKSDVEIIVFDISGERISKLVSQEMNAGKHEVKWDAKNFSSGLYFYCLKINNYNITKKMILLH